MNARSDFWRLAEHAGIEGASSAVADVQNLNLSAALYGSEDDAVDSFPAKQ